MARDPSHNGTVVQMMRFGQRQGYPALQQVEAYWHALRDGRAVPDRSDIDPRGLEDALDVTFVAERIAPGVARMRIAGFRYSELLGMEARGMTLSAMFRPDARKEISDAINACCDTPAQINLAIKSPSEMGRQEIVGRMILLPLCSDLGDVSRILGAVGLTGPIGRTPRRFTLERREVVQLTGDAPRHAPAPTGASAPAQVGFAEPQAVFEAGNASRFRPSKVPHLRVVDD